MYEFANSSAVSERAECNQSSSRRVGIVSGVFQQEITLLLTTRGIETFRKV